MPADPPTAALLFAAAFAAGALNAMAGGGSFLTLPALVFAGVPPVAANATGTAALLPGYIASAYGFRDDLAPLPALSLRMLIVLSLAGGSLGAALLLATGNATFRALVPWLLLGATLLFAVAPWVLRHAKGGGGAGRSGLGVFAVAVYGGYFNGGLGILLLALFGLVGLARLNTANALKNLVSALLTAIAVAIYAAGGAIVWPLALPMAAAAALGGFAGARIARRIPARWLRGFIVATGLVMTALFFRR